MNSADNRVDEAEKGRAGSVTYSSDQIERASSKGDAREGSIPSRPTSDSDATGTVTDGVCDCGAEATTRCPCGAPICQDCKAVVGCYQDSCDRLSRYV